MTRDNIERFRRESRAIPNPGPDSEKEQECTCYNECVCDPTKTQFRVWHSRNTSMLHYPVADYEAARELIDRLTVIDLQSPFVTMNAFGLEEWIDGDWGEWENEEGFQIDDLRRFD